MGRVDGNLDSSRLPQELEYWRQIIHAHAVDAGLTFFPVIFEVLDWNQMNEIAAYGGFPSRYPHWRFGMEYDQLSKSYAYGLSKIYEMVINTNPCYAYLLYCNAMVDQKLVMAHVYGHADFFKNNVYFAHTNRRMIDNMANHKVRVQRHIDRYGRDKVEPFIDIALSLENLIDAHGPAFKREPIESGDTATVTHEDHDPNDRITVTKLKSKSYMDKYINPDSFLDEQRQVIIDERTKKTGHFPPNPVRDILGFLLEYAPLPPWQRDIVDIIRDEAYYFLPQRQTKIMNEGWASYWHAKIMTQKVLSAAEIIDFADHHSGTLSQAGGRLNPYKLGIELFRDIEERFNTGRFGREYEQCDDMVKKEKWDTGANLGREKIFEVRKLYCDLTFLDAFLTPEFCTAHKLFTFGYKQDRKRYEIDSREFKAIKEKLVFNLTNFGQPLIEIEDANYKNRTELLLRHQHFGVDLDLNYARETLQNLFAIWKRPVHILTHAQNAEKTYSYNGDAFCEA